MEGKGQQQRISCQQVNGWELVSYLDSLGFKPVKIQGSAHWYLSPLRSERTASFKVDSKRNLWYDFGTSEGGTVIDFAIRYLRCSVSEVLSRLQHAAPVTWNYSPRPEMVQSPDEQKLRLSAVVPLCSPALLQYLASRKISLELAKQYCAELRFEVNGKHYFGVGFANQSKGWEIRNQFQKYASAPKDISVLKTGSDRVLVFEGFMDFLSFLSLPRPGQHIHSDYVILNGIGLFQRAVPLLSAYRERGLYFDRDTAGKQMTAVALGLGPGYSDHSSLYQGFKDLNDYLVTRPAAKKKTRRLFR
jgi:DNA primase